MGHPLPAATLELQRERIGVHRKDESDEQHCTPEGFSKALDPQESDLGLNSDARPIRPILQSQTPWTDQGQHCQTTEELMVEANTSPNYFL